MTLIPDTLTWWITAVDVPVITGFLILFTRTKTALDRALDEMRDHFMHYKLEVAQHYASINHVKDLEARVISHLLRIETKLDNTALKAHALYTNPLHKPEC